MAFPHYLERVTVCDVLDTGACFDGVKDWIEKHGMVIAGQTTDYALEEYVSRAAGANGYGDGDGDGNGNGYGDGDGNGNGNGYGDGDG